MLQLYTGTTSHFTAGYPLRKESDIPATLQDCIHQHGAPNSLISDGAEIEIGKSILEILRFYKIGQFRSEPEHQNQNKAERQIQDIKRTVNMVMDRTNTPAVFWLLCTLFVIDWHNHLALRSLGDITPIEKMTTQHPDISKFLHFRWWEPVYFYDSDASFPHPHTKERLGRWVGVKQWTQTSIVCTV